MDSVNSTKVILRKLKYSPTLGLIWGRFSSSDNGKNMQSLRFSDKRSRISTPLINTAWKIFDQCVKKKDKDGSTALTVAAFQDLENV